MSNTDTQSLDTINDSKAQDTKNYSIDAEFEALNEEIQSSIETEIELQEKSLSILQAFQWN